MAEERENIRVADEWWGKKSFFPSPEQKARKKKTGSYYRRDSKVEDYDVRKGKFV